MNELTIFKNEEFGEVRTVTINGEPWFVGKDVAEALGYERADNAIRKHIDEDDKLMHQISASGQNRQMYIINESGLYSLILSSKLPNAKKFKHWVTSEVLPSIRKTGQYQMQNLSTEMKAILMHDEKIVKIENRIKKLEYDIPLYGCESDELSAHVKRKGVQVLGGKLSEAYKDTNIRSKVYRDIYDQLKREFGLYAEDNKPVSYKALKRKNLADAHEFIDCYEVSFYLQEMIQNANAQMSFS